MSLTNTENRDPSAKLTPSRKPRNLNQEYKNLCVKDFAFPVQSLLNSLKFGEVVMSVDALIKNKDKPDLKSFKLPLDNFENISLISLYSDVISTEDLEMLN